jgi:uncharacterized protein
VSKVVSNDPQPNTQVALRFLQAIEAGDLAAIDALLAPDFTWWVLGWGDRTRAAFMEGLTRTISGFATRSVKITGITTEGERVAIEAEGCFERPGLVYRNTYHHLFIVRDGRIARGREYLDTRVAAAAFGLPAGDKT